MSGFENPEVRPARVVIMSPKGVYGATSLPRIASGDSVQVVAFVPLDDVATIVLPRPTGFVERLVRVVSRTAVGREVLRLTPLDPGVRFRRAVRRDARVHQALAGADLVIAPERDGVLAAWHATKAAARSGRRTATMFGYPAARAALDRIHS